MQRHYDSNAVSFEEIFYLVEKVLSALDHQNRLVEAIGQVKYFA